MQMMDNKVFESVKGLFYGQAIGDALGLGTEFMSKEEVIRHYPEGLMAYDQIIEDNHRSRWERGAWTDDTDQFLLICDSILEEKEVNERAFARKLREWSLGSPMGIGMTVHKVVNAPQFVEFPHRAAELIWKMSGKKSAANGAVMRTSILGAWEFRELDKVIRNAEKIALVTHTDPRCVGSAVIVSVLVAGMLTGKVFTVEEISALGDQYDERIRPVVELALKQDITDLRLDDKAFMGYTLKALGAGLWAYFHAENYLDGLQRVINEGGDADTNGAVAGSLLGVKFGYSAIPDYLCIGLKNRAQLEEKLEGFLELSLSQPL